MRLLITDPAAVAVDLPDVASVRAEDESGQFGVLPGHADFLTVLIPSVVSWRDRDGGLGYCAVRRGVFTVQGGTQVRIATREAHAGADLDYLEHKVLADYRRQDEQEREARTGAAKLRMQAIRRIVEALRDGRGGVGRGGAGFGL